MFGIQTVKKVGQTVGILPEDQVEEEEVGEEIVQMVVPIKPETMEVPKTVGIVKPIIHNPMDDLEILAPLYGLYKGLDVHAELCCPECDYEEKIPSASKSTLDLDSEFVCDGCGFDETLGDFFVKDVRTINTSRRPSDAELFSVGAHMERSYIDAYYAALHGDKVREEIEAPIDFTARRHCSSRCVETGCTCPSLNLGAMGRLTPLPQPEPLAEFDEEEYHDDD